MGVLTGYNKLIIGKGSKDIGARGSWYGLIDDVRIYSRALSEEEIREVYAGGGPGPVEKPQWLLNMETNESKTNSEANKE